MIVQELNLHVYSVIFQSIIHFFLKMSAFKTIYSSKLLITRVTKECTKTARVHTATPSFELVEPVFQRFMQLHLFPPTPNPPQNVPHFHLALAHFSPSSVRWARQSTCQTPCEPNPESGLVMHILFTFFCILSLHGDIKMHSSWHKCQNIPQPPGGGHVSDSWGVTRVV